MIYDLEHFLAHSLNTLTQLVIYIHFIKNTETYVTTIELVDCIGMSCSMTSSFYLPYTIVTLTERVSLSSPYKQS